MFSTLSDEDLWKSISGGSHDAFSHIVSQYNSNIYRFVKSRIGSEDDAKDILQELFISVWNNREKIDLKTSLEAYLYGAAKYAVIDWQINNKKIMGRIELLLDENQVVAHTHSVEKELIASELKEEILALIDRLPHTVRTVFRMSRVDQKTNSEIAEELQLSDKTVRNNLSLALNFLRKHLDSNLGAAVFGVLIDRIFHK